MAHDASERRIYRIPEEWFVRRKRTANYVFGSVAAAATMTLVVIILSSTDWTKPANSSLLFRTQRVALELLFIVGIAAGFLARSLTVRLLIGPLLGFRVELTETELRRIMNLSETLILRREIVSIQDKKHGLLITDHYGRSIFVPKALADYEAFRRALYEWWV